jgi:hypothetical protein
MDHNSAPGDRPDLQQLGIQHLIGVLISSAVAGTTKPAKAALSAGLIKAAASKARQRTVEPTLADEPLARVTAEHSRTGLRITDRPKFEDWLADHFEGEVRRYAPEFYNDHFPEQALRRLRWDRNAQCAVTSDGEVVPGVEWVIGTPTGNVRVSWTTDGQARLLAALRDAGFVPPEELPALPELPGLPTGSSDQGEAADQ